MQYNVKRYLINCCLVNVHWLIFRVYSGLEHVRRYPTVQGLYSQSRSLKTSICCIKSISSQIELLYGRNKLPVQQRGRRSKKDIQTHKSMTISKKY